MDHIFINTCLPFGLRSAPKLFNIMADLLSWIMMQKGATPCSPFWVSPPNSRYDFWKITSHMRIKICSWLGKKKATKRQILSLMGLLQHTAKVVRPERSFVSRIYATSARVKELDFYIRLGKEFRSDLHIPRKLERSKYIALQQIPPSSTFHYPD